MLKLWTGGLLISLGSLLYSSAGDECVRQGASQLLVQLEGLLPFQDAS